MLRTLPREGEAEVPYGPAHFQSPSGLYNGMLYPAAPYAVRGVIWYQGESNVGEPRLYRELLSTMIRDWRALWSNESLPFGVVQLANVDKPQTIPVEDTGWSGVREAQRLVVRDVPRTGLVVTTDIGDEILVHAPNKQEVGRRLGLWALAKVYGQAQPYSGPVPVEVRYVGAEVTIRFEHALGGLSVSDDGPLRGFALAGMDGRFHWAEASFTSPDTVAVRCVSVPEPVEVRYGWAINPIGNLTNTLGLPATPFRANRDNPE